MKKVIATVGIAAQCGLIATLLFAPSARFVLGGLATIVLACFVWLLCLRQMQKKDKDSARKVPTVVPPRKPIKGKLPSPEEPRYFERYLRLIAEKYGKAAEERVRGDVTAILGKDSNGRIDEILEQQETNGRAKGVVVGRVQSGKTQNYTGLITRAIDEGWNIIIVLTSNNIALGSQTVTRLRDDLFASGLVNGERYQMIDDFLRRDGSGAAPCSIEDGKVYVGIALKQADHLRGRDSNGKGVKGWLEGNKDSLKDASILIIDDEADNATQNTVAGQDDWSDAAVMEYAADIEHKFPNAVGVAKWLHCLLDTPIENQGQGEKDALSLRKEIDKRISSNDVKSIVHNPSFSSLLYLNQEVGGSGPLGQTKFNGHVENYFTCSSSGTRGHSRADDFRQILRWYLSVRRERSEINQAICDLVDSKKFACAKLAYVGYTATPYANFLNEKHGADNPLANDFAQSMSLAPEYFGLSKIFGKDEPKDEPRMPIIKEIPEEARGEGQRDNELCDSLKNAIKWAMAAAAVRFAWRREKKISEKGDKTRSSRWTTMLVNLSRKIEDHGDLREKIQAYIANSISENSSFREECLKIFDTYVGDIDAERFKKLFPDYTAEVCVPCREDVENRLGDVFRNYEVIALNSDGDNQGAYDRYVQDEPGDKLWIIVGGNRISRGLTFDGLVASYFDRDKVTVNVDTLTQMGRWFGYRLGYELLPRVWMPKGTVEVMKEICALEEDMHAQLNSQFETHGDLAPKMLAISKRLTGRDNAQEIEDAVENPLTIREFALSCPADGVKSVQEFITQLGASNREGDERAGKVYQRIDKWMGVERDRILSSLDSIKNYFSASENGRIDKVIGEMVDGRIGGGKIDLSKFDVVLASPENKEPFISLGQHHQVRPSRISQSENVDGRYVRLGKFSGQYDAWKAVVPSDIVAEVERDYGARANAKAAIDEMFERKCDRERSRPRLVLQIGFVTCQDFMSPYVSLYCPGKDCLEQARIGTANVLGEISNDEKTHNVTLKKPLDNVETLVSSNAVPHSLSKPVAKPDAVAEEKGDVDSSASSASKESEESKEEADDTSSQGECACLDYEDKFDVLKKAIRNWKDNADDEADRKLFRQAFLYCSRNGSREDECSKITDNLKYYMWLRCKTGTGEQKRKRWTDGNPKCYFGGDDLARIFKFAQREGLEVPKDVLFIDEAFYRNSVCQHCRDKVHNFLCQLDIKDLLPSEYLFSQDKKKGRDFKKEFGMKLSPHKGFSDQSDTVAFPRAPIVEHVLEFVSRNEEKEECQKLSMSLWNVMVSLTKGGSAKFLMGWHEYMPNGVNIESEKVDVLGLSTRWWLFNQKGRAVKPSSIKDVNDLQDGYIRDGAESLCNSLGIRA